MIRLIATPESRRSAELMDILRRMREPDAEVSAGLGEAVRQGFAENFAGERSGTGRAWNPLAPSTVRERVRLGFPGEHPILVRTGQYRESFLSRSAGDHLHRLQVAAGGWTLEEGSTDYRVKWLEGGTHTADSDWFHIPPRPVTLLSPEAEERLGDFLDDAFDGMRRR